MWSKQLEEQTCPSLRRASYLSLLGRVSRSSMSPNSLGSRLLPLFSASDKPWASQEHLCQFLPSEEESFSPDTSHVPPFLLPMSGKPPPSRGAA